MDSSSQQSSGSSSSRSRSEKNMVVLCDHNEHAPLKTVRFNGPNFGRRFYGCPHWPGPRNCGFIRWENEVNEIHDLQQKIQEHITEVAELELMNQMLLKENRMLKEKYDKQYLDLEESWMENASIRDGLYSANADRRLMVLLIMSWVFFAAVLLRRE